MKSPCADLLIQTLLTFSSLLNWKEIVLIYFIVWVWQYFWIDYIISLFFFRRSFIEKEMEERKKVGVETQIPDATCNEDLSMEGITDRISQRFIFSQWYLTSTLHRAFLLEKLICVYFHYKYIYAHALEKKNLKINQYIHCAVVHCTCTGIVSL